MFANRWTLLSLLCIPLLGCPKVQTSNTSNIETSAEPDQARLSDDLRIFLDEVYDARLATDPIAQHYQGIKDQQDQWTLRTQAYRNARRSEANAALDEMKQRFPIEQLDTQGQLNFRLFEYRVKQSNEAARWEDYGYEVTQMHGTHAWIPSFLINVHRVDSTEDAEAYISRLEGVDAVINLTIEQLKRSHSKGILPPQFVFPMVINDCENLLKGAPFEQGEPGPWLTDITDKINALVDVSPDAKTALIARATRAIESKVGPAYRDLTQTLKQLQAQATTDDGAWKLPDGEAYYAFKLRTTTTTSMTADEIHQTGLDEVARIHREMRAIQAQVGFEGTLQAFFEHLRSDPKYFFENNDQGRQQYLEQATQLIRTIEAKLPEYFLTTPKAPLEVKAVEAYREKSAGKAFYSRGTPDGSRPGTYYANLYDMNSMPIYQMEALAYHEGIPGHHMQNSITQEVKGMAKFRQFSGYTAYGEGWGLYSEYLPKEMGFYQDPYSDFGRLAMELWRACRLVVDTGIHSKKWTREEAIQYLMDNTPNPKPDAVKAIERYIVMPGQATGYKIGMLKILELRARAMDALGEDFQLAEFHEVVLTNGSVPLETLETLIARWIEEKQ